MTTEPYTKETDTSPEAILAAVKQTGYEYFGDYPLSSKELNAIDSLVTAALKLNTALEAVDAAYTAGKVAGLRKAALCCWAVAVGAHGENHPTGEVIAQLCQKKILAMVPTNTTLTGK
jgi:hypothetical protein